MLLSQHRPNAVYECDALLQARIRHTGRAGGGKIRLDGCRHGLAVLPCALDLKRDIGGPGIGVVPRQRHPMIIERYRRQFLRGRRRRVVDGNTQSLDALRPDRAVRVISTQARRLRRASGESEKQHQRNEDRRNAENEDEPVHGNQDADCCGEASGLPGWEWAAPPTKVMNSRRLMGPPKAKDHDLIITPRIAARRGHLCPLRGQKQTKADGRAISTPPVSAGIGQRGEHVRYVHHKRP